mgnify:CR=1 FL=1
MLVRPQERNDLVVKAHEEGDRLIVDAEAVTPEGTFRNGLNVTVSLAARAAPPVSVLGEQMGPGLYRATLEAPETGSAVVSRQRRGWASGLAGVDAGLSRRVQVMKMGNRF